MNHSIANPSPVDYGGHSLAKEKGKNSKQNTNKAESSLNYVRGEEGHYLNANLLRTIYYSLLLMKRQLTNGKGHLNKYVILRSR